MKISFKTETKKSKIIVETFSYLDYIKDYMFFFVITQRDESFVTQVCRGEEERLKYTNRVNLR